jgi:hypothetical protein
VGMRAKNSCLTEQYNADELFITQIKEEINRDQ